MLSAPVSPFTILREDNWKGVFFASPEMPQENVVSASKCEHPPAKTLYELAEARARDQVDFASEIAANRPTIELDTYETAVEIIKYLREHNIRVVFFTPPTLKHILLFIRSMIPRLSQC